MASVAGYRRRSFFAAAPALEAVTVGRWKTMPTEFPYRVTQSDRLPEGFAAATLPETVEAILVPPQGFGRWWNRQEEPTRLLVAGKDRI
jgi:hypothetical protein